MVDRNEYLFHNDPHIGKLWTERYEQLVQAERTDALDRVTNDELVFEKAVVRQFEHNGDYSYQLAITYGRGESETINLNNRGFKPNFNRYHDNFVTDMRLDRDDSFQGCSFKKYSNENAKWQIGVLMNKQRQWLFGALCYNDQYLCLRSANEKSKSGELGSFKTHYREVGFGKFKKVW